MTREEELENERRATEIAEEGRRRTQAIVMTDEVQRCLSACAWIREVAGDPHYMTSGCIGWRVKNGDISAEWLEREFSGAPAGYVKYHIMSATPVHEGRHIERWYKSGKRCEDIEAAVYEMLARSNEEALQ